MSHAPIRTLTNVLLAGSLGLGLSSIALAQEAEAEHGPHMPPAPEAAGKAVAVESEPSWTDNIAIGAFVDAYGALRSDNNEPRAGVPAGPGIPLQQGSPTGYAHEAYVQADGFALAFAGADVGYSGDAFGATMSLRFGPGVNRFFGADQGPFGTSNITQAYLTWKPVDKLTLDLGQFYTLFGAEVAESWRNVNYSRGGLYYAMQPFWHTGLKANYAITDKIGVNAMIVNGVNSSFEGNKSPTVGVQVVATPIDELFIAAGFMGGLHPRDGDDETSATKNFENFFDVVATLTLGDFKLVNNFDLNLYRPKGVKDGENWWGISVAPAYSITNWMGVAGRVEYLSDSANAIFAMKTDDTLATNAKDANLITLTATLDFKPVPNSSALVLRPEFRYEKASDKYFADGDNKPTDGFWTAMLGAVVTSM